MSLHRAQCCLLVLLVSTLSFPQSKPPTIDPTYGFPVPKLNTEAVKLPPDADWVWTRETKDNQTVWFRKSFELTDAPAHATLYATADNYFDAYVNGHEVGKTEKGKDTDYLWAQVHHYDVGQYLQKGTNVIAIIGTNDSSAAGILARLEIDGKPVLFTDYNWRQMETQPPADWMLPTYSDAGWTGALRIASVGGDPWGSKLQGWPVEVRAAAPYLQHLSLRPVLFSGITKPGDIRALRWLDTNGTLRITNLQGEGDWGVVVDFGKELTGRVQINAEFAVQLQIGTGESSSEAIVRPWTTTTVDISPDKPGYSTYTACRYAALIFPASEKKVNIKVSYDHLYYPVEYKGSFDCSDPLLTKIWYTGAYTAHSCMQQDIWDAPKRDRMRWMGDLHVSGEVINNVFADKFLMEHTLSLLRSDAQGGKPFTELPNDHVNDIPGYSCAWVCGLADFYRHVGDQDYINQQHDALISLLEYFRAELDDSGFFANKKGKWPFVDWAPEFDKDTPQARAATHFFFVKALREASFLLKSMGDTANADKYNAWADELTKTAQAHFGSGASTFSDRRQDNSMAIYSGVATPEQTSAIWNAVLNPKSPAWNIMATPYYNNYVIYAMSMSGHTQEALDFVRSYWGGMIHDGATTFWEGYDPSWEKDNFHAHLQADDGTGYFVSLCHGWSAGSTNFLTERILGVRPTAVGFATCDIAPELCGLKWASGVVPTPHGDIKVSVKQRTNGVLLSVVLPDGVKARVAGHEHGASFSITLPN
ncbi:MAG TPA: alpha-L-rhamnosidase C-terminal domain-containing protein [Fimbriimonadaceae bacterium]|jgi:hypothetical protein